MVKALYYFVFILPLFLEVSCFKKTTKDSVLSQVNKETKLKERISITHYGVKVNSKEDQTSLIQNAFKESASNNTILIIKKGVYYINGIGESDNKQYLFDRGGIKVYDNAHIVFEEGAVFKVLPNHFTAYNALRIWNVSNVTIEGANLIGDRKEHQGDKGEWGYGIFIAGSKNITIKNSVISEFWGDGINLNCSFIDGKLKVNHNVVIDKTHSFNNRRQGMSIEAGKNIVVKNSTFENNRGTNPQSGIDIEPWGTEYDFVDKVTIDNCLFVDNPNGVMINFPTLKNIVIKNCEFKSTRKGMVERHIWQLYGDNELEITNCNFDDSAENILIHSGKFTKISNCVFNNQIMIEADDAVNVQVSNSVFNKAKISTYKTKGTLEVFKNKFTETSLIELRGNINSNIYFNDFQNSTEFFISDESTGLTKIYTNNFNNSRIFAIQTDGRLEVMENTSKASNHFLQINHSAKKIVVVNNKVSTNSKESISFIKPKSNIEIYVKNNILYDQTKIFKVNDAVFLENASNALIENNTFKVLNKQKLPKDYKKGNKVAIINEL